MKLAFVGGVLLDGTKDMVPQTNKVVLVDGEKIEDIVNEGEVDLSGYEKVDLKGAYLLPGLINLHGHLSLSGKPPKKEKKKQTDYKKLVKLLTSNALIREVMKRLLTSYAKDELMSGVTTFRVVGGVMDFDGSVRDRINAGKAVGPRILTSNMAISVPGGHFAGAIATESRDPEEAVEDVMKIAKTNPDLIKLMITGGIMDASESGEPGVLRMDPKIVKAACDKAHELGYQVAAHIESPQGVLVGLENGVDTIEHGAVLSDEMIRLFKERKAAHVCTISPAIPYSLFDLSESHALPVAKENSDIVLKGIIECAKTALENGITVGLGNDAGCPFVTHYGFWRELCYFHKYVGASNKDTLHIATLGNAKIIKIDDVTGSIEKGKSADMIVVKKDPLEDLSALSDVSMVCMKGKLITDPKIKRIPEADRVLDKYM